MDKLNTLETRLANSLNLRAVGKSEATQSTSAEAKKMCHFTVSCQDEDFAAFKLHHLKSGF